MQAAVQSGGGREEAERLGSVAAPTMGHPEHCGLARHFTRLCIRKQTPELCRIPGCSLREKVKSEE